MTRYQRRWLAAATAFFGICFCMLIYAIVATDSNEAINQALQNANSSTVKSISIVPYNPAWRINLTASTIIIKDKNDIDDILNSLKSMTSHHFPKGTKTIWNTFLVINFSESFKTKLKDKSQLKFKVFDSKEGTYIEKLNIMGYASYICPDLKIKLENLANFHFPQIGYR